MGKHLKTILAVAAIFVFVIFILDRLVIQQASPSKISYSAFYQRVEHNEIAKVTIAGRDVSGETRGGDHFTTTTPDDRDYLPALRAHNVEISVEQQSSPQFLGLIIQFIPFVLMALLLIFILRQAQSGGSQALSFGRSRAKLLSENRPKVTFNDVAGIEEAKQELAEVVEFLKYPKKFQALGARIPKGVLLLGPPGSGKTLLARAIAGEAGVPFFSISGSDFVEMFVGVGASRVRDLFEQAKKSAPCIVFIDEIDAVGRQRGAGLGGGHDEREQTLNQLLVEMDGFDPNTGVILIAATNRPDVLDPALLRPGRFDRQIVVDRADVKGRAAILAVHAKNKPLSKEISLETLARRTPGFSGADLENLLNEAALLAARQNKNVIEMNDCEEAIDRVIAGPERKSRIISQKEKEIVAYHESGHAIVGGMLPNANPVHKVTIISRGMALGLTMQLPTEDRYLMSKAEIVDQITGLLGGRVAEELQFQEVTTGASNDFEKATELARRMVTQYGMSSELGPIQYGRGSHQVFLGRDFGEERNYSEQIASKIDAEVRGIIETCYANAKSILQQNWHKVQRMVDTLLDKETVEAEEVQAILDDKVFTQKQAKLPAAAVTPVDPDPPRSEKPKRLPTNISPEPA
ncbi:MAG TPA: ATP-dependent zinc metalloprotease FtsH [Candidatus Acidoferrales bacterium]|nr:ATP-dependent zinc metalloprotease FtsH [Candidatus Acidoferrales bacterium]